MLLLRREALSIILPRRSLRVPLLHFATHFTHFTRFTCFTSTTVQILTQDARVRLSGAGGGSETRCRLGASSSLAVLSFVLQVLRP